MSVHKVSVGIDLPTATIGVSARPTRSLTAWVQFLGRLMRVPPAGGYLRPTIQDWGGTALRLALDVHEVWSRGPTWPPAPKVGRASSSSRTSGEPGLPEPCPHHPRIVHPPGETHCTVCGRPLAQEEQKNEKVRKRFRADVITVRDIGRSVLRMAQDRACRPPLDEGVAARRWAQSDGLADDRAPAAPGLASRPVAGRNASDAAPARGAVSATRCAAVRGVDGRARGGPQQASADRNPVAMGEMTSARTVCLRAGHGTDLRDDTGGVQNGN